VQHIDRAAQLLRALNPDKCSGSYFEKGYIVNDDPAKDEYKSNESKESRQVEEKFKYGLRPIQSAMIGHILKCRKNAILLGKEEEHKNTAGQLDWMKFKNTVFCLFKYSDLQCGPISFGDASLPGAGITVTI
jgi:hypothetical protein